MRPTIHVKATRQGRWWGLQAVEHPGAISQTLRLSDAAETIREAIAWIAKVPEDSFDIAIEPELPAEYHSEIAAAKQALERVDKEKAAAAAHNRAAVALLREAGMTVRDIGTVMGVSHQRAAQLLAA